MAPEPIDNEKGLCPTCEAIDFKNLVYSADSAEKPPIPFGSLRDVLLRSTDCRLCATVVASLKERLQQADTESSQVDSSNTDSDSPVPTPIIAETSGSDVLIPTEVDGKEVQCSIFRDFFCTFKPSLEDKQGQQVTIRLNHIRIELEPKLWRPLSARDSVVFHPYWDALRNGPPDSTVTSEDNQPMPTLTTKHGDVPISTPGSGREVSPLVDFRQVRSWLRVCEEEHTDRCSNPPWLPNDTESDEGNFLCVVDVQEMRIVDAPPACRYIALSYVWGPPTDDPMAKCTKANLAQIREPRGLEALPVPRTILDAMHVVRELGERYLWVDALCIVQDDIEEVVQLTSQMDMIFSGAVMTIIAADGDDCHAGLPGVLPGRERQIYQKKVRISDGLSLITRAALSDLSTLPRSKWNTRGWTYQERALSRRALIFTPSQIYWTCECKTLDEEAILEPEAGMWVLPPALGCNTEWDETDPDSAPKFSRSVFSIYITEYSTREFTYPGDALPAFKGLMKRYEFLTGDKLHWGVETSLFDQALCWSYGTTRRTEDCLLECEDSVIRRLKYPSWSWLGWKGFIGGVLPKDDQYEEVLAGTYRPAVWFYLLMSDNSTRPIGDQKEKPAYSWMGEAAITGLVTAEDADILRPASASGAGNGDLSSTSSWPSTTASTMYDTGRIVFRTSHAKLRTKQGPSHGDLLVWIRQEWHTVKSDIFSPSTVFNESYPAVEGLSLEDAEGKDGGGDARDKKDTEWLVDFVVISTHYKIASAEPSGQLNLMLLRPKEDEPGVWRRQGRAVIDEVLWLEAERQWTMVILS